MLSLLVGCSPLATPAPTAVPLPPVEAALPADAVTPLPKVLGNPTESAPAPAREATPVVPREGDLETPASNDPPNVPPKPVERRAAYDTTKPFAELVKPHFFAVTADGELTEARGEPDLLVEHEGRVKVRLADGGSYAYLDLLALESELVGEHPIHKVYRLMAMGVPVASGLQGKLDDGAADGRFAHVEFEYQRRRFAAGVVAEVFPDGTLLVIPDELPGEWQSGQEGIAAPTHLHLNARAFSGGSAKLAREYELEILSLPFAEQRYPPAPLARKQCQVYRESLEAADYRGLLDSVGFRFTAAQATRNLEDGANFADRVQALLWEGAGAGVQYFGFEGLWIGDIFRGEEVSWLGECDTAGGLRAYPGDTEAAGRHYLTIRRSLEPDKKRRYKIMEVDASGAATELYTAPGIILMALPLPFDEQTWLLSTEGWPEAAGDEPADPRWQAVYAVNLDNPDEYVKVRYPIDQFPKAPEAGLYGASPRLSRDAKFLYNTLYGFTDEGGGIWVVDVTAPDFHASGDNFARIVSWDHTLSWLPLGRLEEDPTALHLFMTGKEVADDFAMTANVLRIREAGLESAVEKSERLLQMVGWNPVPFGWQQLSEREYRMLVETHYNYESSLLPRAKGVYIVPVSLSGE